MGDEPQQLVAVDLGSNSFHMVIARLRDGQLTIVDRMREQVKLGAGVSADGILSDEAQARGLQCLRRFGQRLRPFSSAAVRAVGTNTLRRARNAREFLAAAAEALRHPVEVISGREEARLIHLGVAHTLANQHTRRLVVDIGGGSTELIVGEGFEAQRAESFHMGCITYSDRFFADGRLRKEAFRAATLAARVELETIEEPFRALGWGSAVGCSGTIVAIENVIRSSGWGDGITRDALRRLRDALVTAGRSQKVSLPGLSPERIDILPGGLAILYGVFKSLRIERMHTATGALREGVLYDTLGRLAHEDIRERTVARMCERYGVDQEQASRVESTALALFDQALGDPSAADAELRRLCSWAARLHELGLVLSYSGHHKHGSYIVANSDLPGFSRDQQALLASLIGAHRRRLRADRVAALRSWEGTAAALLAALVLRIAATLNRARHVEQVCVPRLVMCGGNLQLSFPVGWLDAHPMTAADLDYERSFLAPGGITLSVQ